MTNDLPRLREATLRWTLCLGSTLAMVGGCSDPNSAQVSGTVLTQGGAPLAGAMVLAREKGTGKAVRGDTDSNGRFELKAEQTGEQIPPGDYEVLIVEPQVATESEVSLSISPKYQSASSSGLTFRVEPGDKKQLSWTLDAPGS